MLQLLAAGTLMRLGAWLHVTELHEHVHVHEELAYDHNHVHDEHRQHAHQEHIDPSHARSLSDLGCRSETVGDREQIRANLRR